MNVAVVSSVVLGAVLLVAGVSKLASRTWPTQAANLNVPSAVAVIVPWLEVVLGAALVAQLHGRIFGSVAVLVLGVFTIKLSSLLLRGQRPPCACFGGRVPRPISWLSVCRNGALIALGVVVTTIS